MTRRRNWNGLCVNVDCVKPPVHTGTCSESSNIPECCCEGIGPDFVVIRHDPTCPYASR